MRRAQRTSTFRTPQGRAEYLAHYHAMLGGWPAHERVEVVGRYGRTTALVSGAVDAPPLVLLHGRYTPSPSWTPVIHRLAARFRVHAIDTIVEPGLSTNDGAPLRTRADYVTWLTETLDGLDLPAAHLMGHSFGGWLAARLAVEHPDRVTSLTLLDPAQVFAPFTLRWLLLCAPPFLFPSRRTTRRFFEVAGGTEPRHRDVVELATLGMTSFRLRAPEAARIPAERLRSLTVPTQQLVARETVVHDPHRAVRAAARLNPAVVSHLVPNSSHFIVDDQPAAVLGALDDQIATRRGRGSTPPAPATDPVTAPASR